MHFVITSVSGDSADLFIGDKNALAQMSCIDTQTHTQTLTHLCAHSCTGSNLQCIQYVELLASTLGGKATWHTQKPAR